eukprot:2452496-Prorocentrum_lima.AAC.1
MTSPALKNVGSKRVTFSRLELVKTSRVVSDHRRQKPTKEATGTGVENMPLESGPIPKIAKAIGADR